MNPDTPDPMAQRLVELEARFSWIERHVAEQDEVIHELGGEQRRLKLDILEMRKRLKDGAEPNSLGEPDTRPPHY